MHTAPQVGRAFRELPSAPSDPSGWWRCRDAMDRHQPVCDFELRRQGDDGRQRV